MRTEVIQGIANVDHDLWNKLTEGHPFASTVWCKYSEVYEQRQAYYMIAYDDDKPVGGAIFRIRYEEVLPTTYRLLDKLINWYLKRRPIITCRSPFRTSYKGFFLPEDVELRQKVLAELLKIAYQLAKKYKASFILADYLNEEELNYDWGDFIKLDNFAKEGNILNVRWQNYEEYLRYIRSMSKRRKRNILANTRKAEGSGISVEFGHEIVSRPDYMRLQKANTENYGLTFQHAHADRFLTTVESALPDENKIWVTAYHNGKVVGCELLIFDTINRVCKPIFYGRDYDIPLVYVYMAYEDVRHSIETLKATVVNYDSDANEFKRRIGFEADYRNKLVFYPNSWFAKLLVKLTLPLMNN